MAANIAKQEEKENATHKIVVLNHSYCSNENATVATTAVTLARTLALHRICHSILHILHPSSKLLISFFLR